jgi:hypothetical protein
MKIFASELASEMFVERGRQVIWATSLTTTYSPVGTV